MSNTNILLKDCDDLNADIKNEDSPIFSTIKPNSLFNNISIRELPEYYIAATSEASIVVAESAKEFFMDSWKSETLSVEKKLIKKLIEIYNECSEDNWDAYGAKKISKKNLELTKNFLLKLPKNIIEPILTPEPTGEIG